MNKNYEEYFKASKEKELPLVEAEVSENEESKYLFTGPMDDIDTWVKFHKLLIEKENQESERELRRENAKKAFYFACVWAIFIGFFIFLHGLDEMINFNISETEFIFVCGTLTASILVFYLTVIKNLFPSPKSNHHKDLL